MLASLKKQTRNANVGEAAGDDDAGLAVLGRNQCRQSEPKNNLRVLDNLDGVGEGVDSRRDDDV